MRHFCAMRSRNLDLQHDDQMRGICANLDTLRVSSFAPRSSPLETVKKRDIGDMANAGWPRGVVLCLLRIH